VTRKILLILLPLGLLATACGPDTTDGDELNRFLGRSEDMPHEFVYEEKTSDTTVRVTGKIEDDMRMQGLLTIDGIQVMEAVVNDDALALRVMDASKVPGTENLVTLVGGSQVVANALLSGQWVIDYSAAPPFIAPKTDYGSLQTGSNFVLDALYIFQYARAAVLNGRTVWFFNPDDILYFPDRDPHPQPNDDLGISRYDVLQPPLPPRSARGTESALPTNAHFRKIAFYVKDGRVFRISEKIDFESHQDFIDAQKGRGLSYHLQLLDSVRQGNAREPIRVRDMSYELKSLGREVNIAFPTSNVLSASLSSVFSPPQPSSSSPAVPTSAESTASG
jgi:hypothetical protein